MFLKQKNTDIIENAEGPDTMPDNTEQKIEEVIRPTKKQQQLLEFIAKFVEEHGYGPSYREIMAGCNYTSVATVALHVGNLIKRGHLIKNGRSARSLEIVSLPKPVKKLATNEVKPAEEKWLVEKIEYVFKQTEQDGIPDKKALQNLETLVESMKILGMEGAANSFGVRINELKKL